MPYYEIYFNSQETAFEKGPGQTNNLEGGFCDWINPLSTKTQREHFCERWCRSWQLVIQHITLVRLTRSFFQKRLLSINYNS